MYKHMHETKTKKTHEEAREGERPKAIQYTSELMSAASSDMKRANN